MTSQNNKKLILGVGINDSPYCVTYVVNGKRKPGAIYQMWKDMLARSYSPKLQARRPTYKGTTICEEWHGFMYFHDWVVKQEWQNKHLDKDIIFPGNKHYSPSTCLFVSSSINAILNTHSRARGQFSQGVCRYKNNPLYMAECKVDGRTVHLGGYQTEQEASDVYRKFKYNHLVGIAHQQDDDRVKNGLLLHAETYNDGAV